MPRPRKEDEKSRSEVRRIVRRVLAEGESVAHVAREEGLSRQTVMSYRDEALRDPDGAFEEAREEMEFRREIMEISE